MRIAALIAATAVALTLTACNRTDEAANDAAAIEATEAAEAAGAAVDTSATTAGDSAGAASRAHPSSGSGADQGQTMDPATGSGSVSDGAMAPGAAPRDTAGDNVTETERRLNPPTAPAQ